ncbi:MAG: glycosyltransferase family 4 protein [Actinomycetota bacterium]|nr:glycosyltransferase family 4 protein [Actinomycetota bacterium]
MRILLWHGYLLAGSGSNLYTANIARVWRSEGHEVLLMCQERDAADFEFVDEQGDFAPDNRSFTLEPAGARTARGLCRVARPFIGGLLPVYVYDEYEGFSVKRFVDLTDSELNSYTKFNVDALAAAIEKFRPSALITGHEVMGPFIALQAQRLTGHDYVAKLHGSALEYAVKEQPRYVRFAQEGLSGAKVVTGGSNYMVREASSVISGWEDRAEVVNPGCDIGLFKPPRQRSNQVPVVGYVGKFIASKGIHHLLAAAGLVGHRMRLEIIGYGGFQSQLRALWEALRSADENAVADIARRGDGRPLPDLLEWLRFGGMDQSFRAHIGAVECSWPGRLDHGPLSKRLPEFDVLVVPSVVPEAFGMVAAEAAACAVLPVVPSHSGIGEVGAAIEEAFDRPGWLTYDPADPIRGIAGVLDRLLEMTPGERFELGLAAAELARERWSWEHVADQLLELAIR